MSRWLRAWLHRGEMPDPVDDAYRSAAALLSDALPRTAGQVLADEVEHWLCAVTCRPEET